MAFRYEKCMVEVTAIFSSVLVIFSNSASPLPSVKIEIIGGKGKTLLGYVNKLFAFTSLLTMPCNVLPLHFRQTHNLNFH